MNKNIEEILEEKVKEALKSLYGLSVGKVAFEKTKKEFEVMQRVADEMERKIRAEINGQDIDV